MRLIENENARYHEHAAGSLKILLLVFGIVLVGALAYLVWMQNTTPDTTSNGVAVTKKTPSTTTPAETSTTTKTTTPPTTNRCKEESFTMPIEKLTICYPRSWHQSFHDNDSAGIIDGFRVGFQLTVLGDTVYTTTSRNIEIKFYPIAYFEQTYNDVGPFSENLGFKAVDSFILNGKTVYLMSPLNYKKDHVNGINMLSSCGTGPKLCSIPSKSNPSLALIVKGYLSRPINIEEPLDMQKDAASKEGIEIIKSLYY